MAEEEENKEKEQEETKEETTEKSESSEKSAIEEGKEILEGIKKERVALEEERKKMEKVVAETQLAGKSFSGQGEKEKTEDEKWAESAKERYAGTGMDPTDE